MLQEHASKLLGFLPKVDISYTSCVLLLCLLTVIDIYVAQQQYLYDITSSTCRTIRPPDDTSNVADCLGLVPFKFEKLSKRPEKGF